MCMGGPGNNANNANGERLTSAGVPASPSMYEGDAGMQTLGFNRGAGRGVSEEDVKAMVDADAAAKKRDAAIDEMLARPVAAAPVASPPALIDRTPAVDVPQSETARWGERYYRTKTARGQNARDDEIGSVARFGSVGSYASSALGSA